MTPTTTHCEFRGYPNNLVTCYTDPVFASKPLPAHAKSLPAAAFTQALREGLAHEGVESSRSAPQEPCNTWVIPIHASSTTMTSWSEARALEGFFRFIKKFL